MAFHHGLFTLAFSALLLAPAAVRADDDHDDDYRWGDQHDASAVGDDTRAEHHIHTGSCYHPAPTPPPPEPPRSRWPRQRGRYELQTVRKWVPGHYEQVWVEQVCKYKHKPHRYVTKCRGGYYEQRWVPGYYQTAQEWVWVPVRHGPRAAVGNGW